MLNLMRRLYARHRLLVVSTSALLAAFQFVTCAAISSWDLSSAMEGFLQFAPPALRAIVEQTMFGGSVEGIMAFTWNHPVTHALTSVVAIALGSRAIAGEIESGLIELLLSQPVSRGRYFAAHVTFAVVALAVVAISGWVGAAVGQAVFGLPPFAWERMARLLANLFLLELCFFSLTLLFSSFGREAGRVAALGAFAAIVSLLVHVVADFWNKAAVVKPFSLHTYFDPREILVHGRLSGASVVVLGAFALVALVSAATRFTTRDLP